MGKGYKEKTCAYCATPRASATGDHVFGRGFFPFAQRANLPKVPSCHTCNNKKSRLETYLMTVLPFGGLHHDAHEMLNSFVPERLENNVSLREQLDSGKTLGRVTADGLLAAEMALPLDGEMLADLFVYIAKGLAFFHWGVPIPADCNVRSGIIHPDGEPYFEKMLAMNGQRVSENIGNGAFQYDAVRSVDDPHVTIWRFRIYGELKVGDPNVQEPLPCRVWVTSSRSKIVNEIFDAA